MTQANAKPTWMDFRSKPLDSIVLIWRPDKTVAALLQLCFTLAWLRWRWTNDFRRTKGFLCCRLIQTLVLAAVYQNNPQVDRGILQETFDFQLWARFSLVGRPHSTFSPLGNYFLTFNSEIRSQYWRPRLLDILSLIWMPKAKRNRLVLIFIWDFCFVLILAEQNPSLKKTREMKKV